MLPQPMRACVLPVSLWVPPVAGRAAEMVEHASANACRHAPKPLTKALHSSHEKGGELEETEQAHKKPGEGLLFLAPLGRRR